MGLCYTTSSWADRLWQSHVDNTQTAQELLQKGQSRQTDYDGFAKDIHSRLYLDNEPTKLDGGPPWAEKLHSAASDLSEWKQLKFRCRHDGFISGIATEAILQSLSDQIPESQTDTDGPDLPYSGTPSGPGTGQGGDPVAWTDQADTDGSETRRRLRKAIREARDRVVEIEGGLDGLQAPLGLRRPGTQVGEQVTYKDIDKIREAYKKLQGSRNLKQIAQLAGRLSRLASSKRRTKVQGTVGAVKGVELSGDLSRVLPSELAGLRGSRYERLLTLSKLVDRRALSYRLESQDTQARGPIIVCQDLSRSMVEGGRDLFAKAVSLALLGTAASQSRDYAVIGFDRVIRHVDVVKAGESTPEIITAILSHAPMGGTDFTPPISKSVDIIEMSETMKKADIIIITDGEADLDSDVADRLKTLTAQGVNVFVIAIGSEIKEIKEGSLSTVATSIACLPSVKLSSGTDPVLYEAINCQGE